MNWDAEILHIKRKLEASEEDHRYNINELLDLLDTMKDTIEALEKDKERLDETIDDLHQQISDLHEGMDYLNEMLYEQYDDN